MSPNTCTSRGVGSCSSSRKGAEKDDLGALAGPPCRRSVEALGVIGVPAQDLVPLDRVHVRRIGGLRPSL